MDKAPAGGEGGDDGKEYVADRECVLELQRQGRLADQVTKKEKKKPTCYTPTLPMHQWHFGRERETHKKKKKISHARTYPWPTCYTPALPIHQWHFGEKAGKQTHTEKPCLSHAHVFVFPTSGTRVAFFVDLTGCFLCVLREQLVGQIKEMRAGLERHG